MPEEPVDTAGIHVILALNSWLRIRRLHTWGLQPPPPFCQPQQPAGVLEKMLQTWCEAKEP